MICSCWVALILGRYVYLPRTNKEMFQYARESMKYFILKAPKKGSCQWKMGKF